ncbi:MAG: sigma-54-dependent Fis family transcriptional regulator [Lentisphaerae bacterium]|nr:sigma-54-dependent Fis family transcriptional regulator [Lentisphaerota bacterium]
MKNNERKVSVLVVDDDKNTRDGLFRALSRTYEVLLAESGEKALNVLNKRQVDILLSDVKMPGMDGLTLLQRAMARSDGIVCILLTAYGNVETAVEAMKRGAYDFLTKPVNLDHLEMLLQRAVRSTRMESENANLHEQLDNKYGLENMIGTSSVMTNVFDVIKQAAPSQATVLIEGASGTGKELVAHAIHRLSTRAKGPFVAVHCAALAPTLMESELFGHEKGAFTGAAFQRRGRFELADGGTLFLDEVSEIEPGVQVKLLRVLEERSFERVGGGAVETDIRLIAATNKDLKALVDAGKFREDLFFRLDVIRISLPSLRDRVGDIPLLCGHFLHEFAEANGKNIEGITSDAVNILSAYEWPGNVRELRNAIEKMVVLSKGKRLTARDIPMNIKTAVPDGVARHFASANIPPATKSLADTEERMIMDALRQFDDNRTKAAKALGISRRTLHRKLNRYATGKE